MLYDNLRIACERKGTTLTTVLKELGRSTGSVGYWKKGKSPNLDIAIEIAQHLGISLDDLVYGSASSATHNIASVMPSPVDEEWVEIITHIPEDKQKMCKDFLRTHMVIPERNVNSKMA